MSLKMDQTGGGTHKRKDIAPGVGVVSGSCTGVSVGAVVFVIVAGGSGDGVSPPAGKPEQLVDNTITRSSAVEINLAIFPYAMICIIARFLITADTQSNMFKSGEVPSST